MIFFIKRVKNKKILQHAKNKKIKPIATTIDVKTMLEKTFDSLLGGKEKESHLKKEFSALFKKTVESVYKDLGMKNKSLNAFVNQINKEHYQIKVNMIDQFTKMKKALKAQT